MKVSKGSRFDTTRRQSEPSYRFARKHSEIAHTFKAKHKSSTSKPSGWQASSVKCPWNEKIRNLRQKSLPRERHSEHEYQGGCYVILWVRARLTSSWANGFLWNFRFEVVFETGIARQQQVKQMYAPLQNMPCYAIHLIQQSCLLKWIYSRRNRPDTNHTIIGSELWGLLVNDRKQTSCNLFGSLGVIIFVLTCQRRT